MVSQYLKATIGNTAQLVYIMHGVHVRLSRYWYTINIMYTDYIHYVSGIYSETSPLQMYPSKTVALVIGIDHKGSKHCLVNSTCTNGCHRHKYIHASNLVSSPSPTVWKWPSEVTWLLYIFSYSVTVQLLNTIPVQLPIPETCYLPWSSWGSDPHLLKCSITHSILVCTPYL